MINDMNLVVMTGRLIKKPEPRETKTGNILTVYTLAVNQYKPKDKSTDTMYVDCVSFGATGDFLQKYTDKGDEILIESGQLSIREGRNKSGEVIKNPTVTARKVTLTRRAKANIPPKAAQTAGDADDNGITQATPPPEDAYAAYESMPDDELPF